MATKITNPSVPEEQVSNAEYVQKTSASEAPAAELVTVAVPAEDPAGEPVAAAVGETAAEPPVVNLFDEAIRAPKPYAAQVEGREKDFVLKNGKNYYLFCFSLPVFANENVALNEAKSDKYTDQFTLAGETVKRVYWMETGTDAVYKQDGNTLLVQAEPFTYGNNTVVRVAKIECE